MKVRILSGNARGLIVEMSRKEAEASVATGYAEAVPEEPSPVVVKDVPVVEEEKPRPRRSKREGE